MPYFNSLTDERIATAISYGIPGTGMRPFADKIPGRTRSGVWLVRSENFPESEEPMTTDVNRREFLFKAAVIAGLGAVGDGLRLDLR